MNICREFHVNCVRKSSNFADKARQHRTPRESRGWSALLRTATAILMIYGAVNW